MPLVLILAPPTLHPFNAVVAYDRSAAIRLRTTTPVRSDPGNPYDATSANFTTTKKSVTREWAIGSAEFKATLAGALAGNDRNADRLELLAADKEQHRRVRADIWEEKLRRCAAALGMTLETLPAMKSAPEKVMLAALLKCVSSVSNGWLTHRLHMGKASSVSQFIGRFRRSGGTETRAFKIARSKVEA